MLVQSPSESPSRPGGLAILPGLLWLDVKRLARAWRWRALVGICLVLSYFFDRGAGFGQGATVGFPGGSAGVLVFGLIVSLGGLVLGVDLTGQVDRHRMRALVDTRSFPGLSVQGARVLAAGAGAMAAALVPAFFPFLSPFNEQQYLLAAPSLVFLISVLFVLALLGASAGVAARSWTGTDGTAVVLGALLVSPLVWQRLWVSRPEEIFLSASQTLGILIPDRVLIGDALWCLLGVAFFVGLAGLRPRLIRPKSPVRLTSDPAKSRLPHLRSATDQVLLGLRGFGISSAVSLILLATGSTAFHWAASLRPIPAMEADWAAMREPAGAERGTVYPPLITRRVIECPRGPGDGLTATLGLRSSRAHPQELAGITFGPTLEFGSVERTDGGAVMVEPDATSRDLSSQVLRFSPPLLPGQSTEARFTLQPRRAASRLWERTRHDVYATYSPLPYWYGEGLLIRYPFASFQVTQQPAPYEILLPDVSPRRWVCGAASVSGSEDGSVTVAMDVPRIPRGLFASEIETVTWEERPEDVQFHVFPEHRVIAESILIANSQPLERLFRAFGSGRIPLVFYEVPGQATPDAHAISASTMDRLSFLLEDFDDYRKPTAGEFSAVFREPHRAAVSDLFGGNFAGFEAPLLLREAWIEYLDTYGLMGGQTRGFRARRDFVLVPWEWHPLGQKFPFDLRPTDEAMYRGPLLAADRPASLPLPPEKRFLAFHHMLRGILGEDHTVRMIRALMDEHRDQALHLEDLLRGAEAVHGEPLDWFFHQWLVEGVIPRYVIREAQVVLAENLESRDLEYTTQVLVANEGDGRMPVPVTLVTEGDTIETSIDIGPGQEVTCRFVTAERPLSFHVDPNGWILQMPPFDEKAKRPLHPVVYLKTVKEL